MTGSRRLRFPWRMKRLAVSLAAAVFAAGVLSSCTTTPEPQTDQERAAERRIENQQKRIRKNMRRQSADTGTGDLLIASTDEPAAL